LAGKEGISLKQHRYRYMNLLLLLSIGTLLGSLGCLGCSQEQGGDSYLLRINHVTVSLSEFNRAVEAAGEEAFPGERDLGDEVMKDLRLRVLNQLGEELMITAFAADHGIILADGELDKAVADIKSDYPDGTFEETLLENAVSFEYWKKKLATRLLVKKVIEKELVDKVQITTDDVADYYNKHYPEGISRDEDADEINRRIVRHLRQQKAETAYKSWIEQLRNSYPLEINKKILGKLTGNPT
jgi:hypothetical protein